jgi:hypothetical protein
MTSRPSFSFLYSSILFIFANTHSRAARKLSRGRQVSTHSHPGCWYARDLIPFSVHRSLEIGIDVELLRKPIVLEITLQRWIEITKTQHAGPLIDFLLERGD